MIDRIQRVPLREVWAHEAHDFTTWLEQNIDILNDYIEPAIDSESVRREQSAGDFSVDLVAEDEAGATVVIENQLERSDHDHLGKVLTYLAAFDAERAIWIVGDPRPEHVRAIAWLNDSSPAEFYLFKLEAIRIGDSSPAALLTQIVGPAHTSKQAARSKKEKGARHQSRREFFTALQEHAAGITKLHATRTPPDGPYFDSASGVRGIIYNYGVRKDEVTTGIWIDAGIGSEQWCEDAFIELHNHKNEIEEAFGGPLVWHSKPGNRSRRVYFETDAGGWSDPDSWDKVIPLAVDAMVRFEAALSPYLDAVESSTTA
jgi:hypothetical protein